MAVVILAALTLLLASAAMCDLASRLIPNRLCLFVALGGLLLRVGAGATYDGSLWAITALLLVLLLLFARSLLGGGDLKLMAALSVALTAGDCFRFVVATSLFGGILALAYLLLRRLLPPLRCRPGASRLLRIAALETWRIHRGLPLPYGVAIAAGGIFVLLHPTHW